MEAAIETIAPDDAHCAQSPAGMLLIIQPFCSISFAFALASPFVLQGKYFERLLPMISSLVRLNFYLSITLLLLVSRDFWLEFC